MVNIDIYTTSYCPFCIRAKKLLANKGLIIKKIRIQRGITRDILAIKSKISLTGALIGFEYDVLSGIKPPSSNLLFFKYLISSEFSSGLKYSIFGKLNSKSCFASTFRAK